MRLTDLALAERNMVDTTSAQPQSQDTTSKVLITTTSFGGGGTERYVEDLASGLAANDIRVAVAVDSGPLDRVRRLSKARVPVHVLGSGQMRASQYLDAFRSLVQRVQPRLIHVNSWLHVDEIVTVASEHRIPILCTNHCTPRRPLLREWLGVNGIPFALYRQRALARRSGPAISISHLGLRNLRIRLGYDVNSLVVYNGVPYVESPKTSARTTDAPRVIWLGSLIERKRPILAISVIERVLKVYPKAQLIVLGDGPQLSEVHSASQRLPIGAVQIRGFSTSVIESLREADVYLQTSADEGLAYSVLDAMSVGLPVIATDAGATREAVLHGKTGLICRIDDATNLARSLVQVLESSETLETYGREGLRRARDVFGVNRMVRETLAAYGKLCSVEFSSDDSRN